MVTMQLGILFPCFFEACDVNIVFNDMSANMFLSLQCHDMKVNTYFYLFSLNVLNISRLVQLLPDTSPASYFAHEL